MLIPHQINARIEVLTILVSKLHNANTFGCIKKSIKDDFSLHSRDECLENAAELKQKKKRENK